MQSLISATKLFGKERGYYPIKVANSEQGSLIFSSPHALIHRVVIVVKTILCALIDREEAQRASLVADR